MIEDKQLFSRSKDKDTVRSVRIGQILSARNDTDKIFKLNQSVKLRENKLNNSWNKKKTDSKLDSHRTEIKSTLQNIYQEQYSDL